MGKISVKFFILLFFLFFALPVFAFEPFINSGQNPLPFDGSFAGWNETRQYQPYVLWENGMFKMWYASYNGNNFKIAYATSTNGTAWARQRLLDVYPGFDNHDPSILKTFSGYKMFFAASTNGGSQNFKIYQIDSGNETEFNPTSRKLVLEPLGSMESAGISSPFVFYENGTYNLFYLCWGNLGLRVCLATSTDGGNSWQRCQNNPITQEISDGPAIFSKEGKYYLFFQSPLGVRVTETTGPISCTSTWTNLQTALPDSNIGPSVFEYQNLIYLYYAGFSQAGIKIHLATSGTTLSPTPTLTQTPTPTQIPQQRKIVIIPGMFASWNKNAMLYNSTVSFDQWKLLDFVKEYQGLIQTLGNLNYQKDSDYFLFAYDWRKDLNLIADDLKRFLQNKNINNDRLAFIGHSLGGLVSRIYNQKYGFNPDSRLLILGSPHLGTAGVYSLVEAGEIEKENTIMWLMQKLILQLNRKRFETSKQTVQSIIPVARNLFPIYDFLIRENEEFIPVSQMEIKNNLLPDYTESFPQFYPILTTIAGNKGENTLSGFKIKKPTNLDFLLGNYPDGHPIKKIEAEGDNIITLSSALAGNDQVSYPADHGEIIYKKQSIKGILDELNISYNENQIVEGNSTKISLSLIFALLSPAEMQVDFNSQIFPENEGLVFVENAQTGNYQLKIKGKNPGGRYTVLIGQIGQNDDKWFEIQGEINSILPFLQTDTYIINFNPINLLDFPVNQNDINSLFDLLLKRLEFIYKDYSNPNLKEAVEVLKDAKVFFNRQNYFKMRKNLLEVLDELFDVRRKHNTILRNEILTSLTQLENLYQKTVDVSDYSPKRKEIENKFKNLSKEYLRLEEKLVTEKKKEDDDDLEEAVSLSLMLEKLQKAEDELNDNQLAYSEILLFSGQFLAKETK